MPETTFKSSDIVSQATSDDAWRPLLTPEAEAAQALLDSCATLKEFQGRIGELAKRDPESVTSNLARILFTGHVSGQLGIDLDAHDN